MRRKSGWLAGVLLLQLTGCFNEEHKTQDAATADSTQVTALEGIHRFKQEFEEVNGQKSTSGKNTQIAVSIDEANEVIYVNEADVLNLDSGVVLFGFPTCPWCRNVVEPLLDFAAEANVPIYYLNISAIRDTKVLKDGVVVTTNEGTEGYRAILEKFADILNPYADLDDDSIKRITSSTVVFINDNKGISKSVGTVESQTNAFVKLTPEQHNELKQRYAARYAETQN